MYPCQQSGQKERGKICKLCDRKFLIKDMILMSSKQIKMHNDVIQNTLMQRTNLENAIRDLEVDHERDTEQN